MAGPAPGLIVAAPASGTGKTLVTLALIRALVRKGLRVAAAKAGPDYIDLAYHAAAGADPCFNLDIWAMREGTLSALAGALSAEADIVVCEGVMGLYDAAADGRGSTADLALLTGWPVLFVDDVRGKGASVAALVWGFSALRSDLPFTGVLLNQVGGEAHRRILAEALARILPDMPVFGMLPRDDSLVLPDRHLGLVQAGEHRDLDAFLDRAADLLADNTDLARLCGAARAGGKSGGTATPLPPLGQRIAVARDEAFAFSYASVLEGWRAQGAELIFFSPLADEAPDRPADAVYLPGGYPELHAGRLAANGRFLGGLREAAAGGAAVFGECGGYMVMGRGLVDESGARHEMAGLLPLETSFAERKLHLGYRAATVASDSPLGAPGLCYTGHEFHYATVVHEGPADRLFTVADARDAGLGRAGLVVGRVAGSFIHLIDRAE